MRKTRMSKTGITSLYVTMMLSFLVPALLFADDEKPTLHAFYAFGKAGLYSTNGTIIIPPRFDSISSFSDGLALIRLGGEYKSKCNCFVGASYGFIDETGKLVIPADYEQAGSFSEGLAPVKEKDGNWGYIDRSGHMVIKPIYEYAYPFNQGLAQVSFINSKGKFGFIDKTGRVVIEPIFEYYDENRRCFSGVRFYEGLAGVKDGSNKKYGFIDKKGKFVIPPKYDFAYAFKNGMAQVKEAIGGSKGKYGFINRKGEFVVPPQFDFIGIFNDGIASIHVFNPGSSKEGFIDSSGKVIVQPQFEYARNFSEGLAAVCPHDKWGYIDRSGDMVIEPQFDDAEKFSEGLAAVKLPDKRSGSGELIAGQYGFIDRSGQFIIKPRFESAYLFEDGIARVKIIMKENPNKNSSDSYVGYIDRKGSFIIEPEFNEISVFHNNPYAEARKVYRKDRHGKILSSEQGLIDKTGTFIWSEKRDSGKKDPFEKGYCAVNMDGASGPANPRIILRSFNKGTVKNEYPQFEGMADTTIQDEINRKIKDHFYWDTTNKNRDYYGDFSLKYNRNNVVSLTLSTGYYAHGAPHGYANMVGYTINADSGATYDLPGLFQRNTDWLTRLDKFVRKEIQTKIDKEELSLFNPFEGMKGDEKFIISEDSGSLVIFYDVYEIAAYVYGIVRVEIPLKYLDDILKPEFIAHTD